jgi:tight adherence protein C
MTLPLILLVALIVGAVATMAFVFVAGRQRSVVLGRADGRQGNVVIPASILLDSGRTLTARLGAWLEERLPSSIAESQDANDKLTHAGFDDPAAPIIFAAVRLVFGVLVPAVVFALASAADTQTMLIYVGIAAGIGVLGPPALLDRLVQRRRDRIRFAMPDALDLLVVCVEAGVSLDSAILRVARDMATTHPDLSSEFLIVNRRVNAGIPRERALQGLWERTGLEDLRGLVSSMVQSEKWGTSIAKVLRINAETLRRKRKQAAEKKAAEAGLKMMFPLMLFLLPALFVVILGPAAMSIATNFKGLQ